MKQKKIVNVGEVFLSWEVLELADSKRYRYRCRCTECGKEREFIKYNLIKGSYAPCKTCGHKKIRNIPLIKKHWNSELNGAIFDKPESFSLTQSYWFICNQGHNFKSSIKDFKLDRCIACTEYPPNHPSKIQAKEYATQYFKTVSKLVDIDYFMLLIQDMNIVLHLYEEDRYTTDMVYFNSESELLKEIDLVSKLEHDCKSQGYKFIKIPLSKNFKNNVDTFKNVMLRLVQSIENVD